MKLIAGLGNPGPQYDHTRHNVGFVVLDRLARRHAPGAIARSRFQGATIDASLGDEKVVLLKPLTFMNRSGQSVAEAVTFYKLNAATDLLVIVDDVALPCGSIRLRAEGSAGGHNGLGDIEQKLGTIEYARLRIGIDGPGQIPQKDYVLGRFRPDQLELVEPALDEAAEAAWCWVNDGITTAMNRFNRKTESIRSS
ncbi:MAG: aminoacyl-tRNA hydrolase [Phycisphaerales bacterium]|nr:aminoacyl-tRNA hydrolase [Phycisphaerales bacterium]MCI0630880.1 aminoacyl-tRNA hydrolase [Phycisphaerales bacterium]MCI0676177.1 aminoacyl-tRNA hydrolase [Phycisphaerales bacterium]